MMVAYQDFNGNKYNISSDQAIEKCPFNSIRTRNGENKFLFVFRNIFSHLWKWIFQKINFSSIAQNLYFSFVFIFVAPAKSELSGRLYFNSSGQIKASVWGTIEFKRIVHIVAIFEKRPLKNIFEIRLPFCVTNNLLAGQFERVASTPQKHYYDSLCLLLYWSVDRLKAGKQSSESAGALSTCNYNANNDDVPENYGWRMLPIEQASRAMRLPSERQNHPNMINA